MKMSLQHNKDLFQLEFKPRSKKWNAFYATQKMISIYKVECIYE